MGERLDVPGFLGMLYVFKVGFWTLEMVAERKKTSSASKAFILLRLSSLRWLVSAL